MYGRKDERAKGIRVERKDEEGRADIEKADYSGT